jgi:DNA-binding MarR family transcriptional regulator
MDIEQIIEKLSQSMEQYETQTFNSSPLKDLTPTQIHYLDAVFHLSGPTVSDLAAHLNVSKPTVTFAVNKLEALGFVEKIQMDEDRRFFNVRLTAKGNELARLHDEIHTSYAGLFRQVLNKTELHTLEKLLGKVLKEM